MADQLLDTIREAAEGQIDFEGQRVVDNLVLLLLSLSGAISFIVGFLLQDIKLALYVGLLGTALTFVVVVPPWPFFNKHPVKWLPAGSGF
ncbi:related to microsomal signal peptidase 12 kDa subunit [Cephalotrichum gorgonifer]|uniref:Signal peptidase complex subunit 1 n=1 Tax=Cephalotrichum gorgonifer TaxID=2041049 RepID=A0AAE8MQV8_9PEZI|nr:related to microsomal signal peptidase 12 kDa subunit [Cephalotrichum gorgonifer]